MCEFYLPFLPWKTTPKLVWVKGRRGLKAHCGEVLVQVEHSWVIDSVKEGRRLE